MILVTVDGKQFQFDPSAVKTMGDLVELIKASIDPDRMIASLSIGGQQLSEADWRVPLSVQGSSTLEVTTLTRADFTKSRLIQAPQHLDHISATFVKAREAFQDAKNDDGNTYLTTAVNDLRAFFQWYSSIIESGGDAAAGFNARLEQPVRGLTDICEQLVQQQLYNAWWAIGETLQTKLEPAIQELRSVCNQLAPSAE